MNAKANTLAEVATPAIPKETNDDLTIVAGTREKRRILEVYKKHFGSGYPDSIVTTRKGLQVSTASDLQLLNKRMRPSKDKYYWVETLELYCVIATLFKDFQKDFQLQDLHNLRLVCKTFASMIPKIIRWLKIDFSLLCKPRYNYEKQECIDPHRVEMASAAMVHFRLDPGKFVQWLGGKYTGYHRNVQTTLDAVQFHVTPDNFEHMKRILPDNCPAEFMFTEPLDNKLAILKRGNLKTFKVNPDLIKKAMNKEDHYSHLVPINEDICRASAFCHSTTQTVVIKPGKANQIAWDGSTMLFATDIVMNQVTPISREAPITCGHVKIQLYIDIYNTRLSNPTATILLGMADIKACFRFPRIHPNLTGAFGFVAGGYYNLATAMVFGSTMSAPCWEPFR